MPARTPRPRLGPARLVVPAASAMLAAGLVAGVVPQGTAGANEEPGSPVSATSTDTAGDPTPSPSPTATPPVNTPPVAVDDEATSTVDQPVTVDVLGNDSDVDDDPLVVSSVTQPTSGSVTVDEGALTATYTPAAGFTGQDVFTYTVSDGVDQATATVTVTVTAATNSAPVAVDDTARTIWGRTVLIPVLANDTDTDGDQLRVRVVTAPPQGKAVVRQGVVEYTPIGTFVGDDTFTYRVSDGRGGTATAAVTVTVTPRFAVTITVRDRVVGLRTARVSGSVSTRIGGPVTVRLERRVGGEWTAAGSPRVRADGSFGRAWTPRVTERTAWRAVARWANGRQATSPAARTEVVARLDAVVSPVRARDVPHSWRKGCPVGPSRLRSIELTYRNYAGRLKRGTLVGAQWAVSDYVYAFRRALARDFRIKKMHPVDKYRAVDERSMAAGNTSAFNCRHVVGNPYRMSQHSWGDAIDINPFENPYATSSRVYPAAAALKYYHRRHQNLGDPGVITSSSAIARAFWSRGWSWGARWVPHDYHHWSRNGG